MILHARAASSIKLSEYAIISQKHARRWALNCRRCERVGECLCAWIPVNDFHPIQSLFPPCAQSTATLTSRKALSGDEWTDTLAVTLWCYTVHAYKQQVAVVHEWMTQLSSLRYLLKSHSWISAAKEFITSLIKPRSHIKGTGSAFPEASVGFFVSFVLKASDRYCVNFLWSKTTANSLLVAHLELFLYLCVIYGSFEQSMPFLRQPVRWWGQFRSFIYRITIRDQNNLVKIYIF